MKFVTVSQMQQAERDCANLALPLIKLMENAEEVPLRKSAI